MLRILPLQEMSLGLTFAALTGKCIVVIPRGLVSAHHTQLLPFDPARLGRVSGPLAHCRYEHGGFLHLSLKAGRPQRPLPQFIQAGRGVPVLRTVWRVVVLTGVVRRGCHGGLHGGVLHAGIGGKWKRFWVLE